MKNTLAICLILIVILFYSADSKVVDKYFSKEDFQTDKESIFLTKFDFGTNGGTISITAMHRQLSHSTQRVLHIDMVKDDRLTEYLTLNCQQKHKLNQLTQSIILKPKQTAHKIKHTIPPQQIQHIYSFYLNNCNKSLSPIIVDHKQQLTLQISLLNDGSHFGQDQKILPGYLLLVLLWISMVGYFFNTIADVFIHSKDNTKIISFTGLIVIGIAYMYRLIHLTLYYSNGQGMYVFEILYQIIKTLCEFIIVTFLIAISWGWSLTHLKHDKTYIYFGTISTFIHLVLFITASLQDENAQYHHFYDSIEGVIILGSRMLLLLIAIVGILRTLNLSVGNVRNFVKKLAIIVFIYLSINPLTVLFSEFFLPNYIHHEFITFIQQIVHLLASGLLCQTLANPQSSYRKISIKEEDNPLSMRNYKHN